MPPLCYSADLPGGVLWIWVFGESHSLAIYNAVRSLGALLHCRIPSSLL